MIIDCVADLHGHHPKLDGGDLLIVAGDLTARDTLLQHTKFQIWLHDQNYKKKIVIAGNHDNRLQELPFESIQRQYVEMGENYLSDSGTKFEGIKIWGSPWTKTFDGINPDCMAFTSNTDEELEKKWQLIPDDTEILITHSPMFRMLDKNKREEYCGSKSLREKIFTLKNLKLHIFGHIHEGYGSCMLPSDFPEIGFINCSIMNMYYQPINKPIRVIL